MAKWLSEQRKTVIVMEAAKKWSRVENVGLATFSEGRRPAPEGLPSSASPYADAPSGRRNRTGRHRAYGPIGGSPWRAIFFLARSIVSMANNATTLGMEWDILA